MRPPWLTWRKEGATVGLYAPNLLGYTWPTMDETTGCDSERRSQSLKLILSSDRGLQLAHVKLESLVIAFQHNAVNTSLLLAHTARQATQMGVR